MSAEFFPYYFQPDGVTLQIKALYIDNKAYPHLVNHENNTVDIATFPNWTNAELAVQAEINSQVPQVAFPPAERTACPWRVVVRIESLMGNTKQVGWRERQELAPSDDNSLQWNGKLEFSRNDVGAALRLCAFVTRSKDSISSPSGFANESGLRLAKSPEWVVQIDPRSLPPGKSMQVKWMNFKTCSDLRLNQAYENIYFLDLDQNVPILYLNEDVQDLKPILSREGHIGAVAAMRDALFHSIAQPVWLSLILISVTTQHEDETARPEWQQSVLRRIAPVLYPDLGEANAIKKLLADGQNPQAHILLLQRLTTTIQTMLDLKKTTIRLFKIQS